MNFLASALISEVSGSTLFEGAPLHEKRNISHVLLVSRVRLRGQSCTSMPWCPTVIHLRLEPVRMRRWKRVGVQLFGPIDRWVGRLRSFSRRPCRRRVSYFTDERPRR